MTLDIDTDHPMFDGLTGPQKRIIALRYWLMGKEYFLALDALDFASRYHVGVRKDGITPELDHQVTIALYVRTLMLPKDEIETVLCVVLLHDVREDYSQPENVPAGQVPVTEELMRVTFGDVIAHNVELLSKVVNGVKKDEAFYFAQIRTSWIACLGKLVDRLHNLSTMQGAFSKAKQVEYVREAEQLILPLARHARRRFARYETAFENAKHGITLQINLLKVLNAAGE